MATFEGSIADLLSLNTVPVTSTPPPNTACVQLVSTHDNNGDAISIVVLRSPHLIPLDNIEKVFAYTLVYTARAFLVDDVAQMSAEDRQDHLSHTFLGGGNVFLLGNLSSSTNATSTNINIFAHANYHNYDIPPTTNIGTADDQGQGSGSRALYLSGVCCDPQQQGRGFATTLMKESIQLLRKMARVKYLTMRTMNHAVVKCCQRSIQPKDQDHTSEQHKDHTKVPVPVYPVDAMEHRPDLIHVCNTITNILGWKGVIAERLIIERAYPDFLIPIFCGTIDRNKEDPVLRRVEDIINRDQGDAMCCIIDL